MEQFEVGTKVFMGKDCLQQLKKMDIKKAFIILDPFMKTSNMVSRITDVLDECSITYDLFSEVIPDPTIEVVQQAVKQMNSFNPDTIIAFGGGSAIDTAKAVRFIDFVSSKEEKELKFVAIPTTSGTGSEVTSFAVITDNQAGAKYPLVSEKMLPTVALLDPAFTLSVPQSITADTGMDVLTHALEAYVSTEANDFTDALAEKAVRIVWDTLEKTVKDGDNFENRMHLHNASCLAGIAFNQTSLGICHSLAHALGANFHIPHGKSNALLLPHIIDFNANKGKEATLSKYAQIARLVGVYGSSDVTTVCMFVQKLKNLMTNIGIPLYVNDLDIDLADYETKVGFMAEKAFEDKCTLTNPVKPSQTDLENIYLQLLKGGRI